MVVGRGVRLSRESGKSLVEHVDSEGVYSAQEHVDTQVEFQPFDEEWLVQVSLDHVVVVGVHVVQVPSQENASALAGGLWLHNERLVVLLFAVELTPEVRVLRGQKEGLRKELVIIWKHLFHSP